MEDCDIVTLLCDRSENAIKEIDIKYGKLCQYISNNILHNDEDVRECVNDAYLGIWNSIPPNHPNSLKTYLCKIVRNISAKKYRDNHVAKRFHEHEMSLDELAECVPGNHNIEEEICEKELTEFIENFLRTLDAKKRIMFVRRYWYAESVKDIALSYGISERNAAMRLCRIRKKLYQYLEEKGVVV